MIDIVMPVFNTPVKDLELSIRSIRSQTLNKWQCYIVDDGSTNQDTIQYLHDLESLDDRFHISFTSNHGPSYARNTGIQLCEDDYLTFCDSDDVLDPCFIEKAVSLISEFEPEFIIGSINNENKDQSLTLKAPITDGYLKYDNKTNKQLIDYLLAAASNQSNRELGSLLMGRIYGKVYKKDMFKDIEFDPDLKIHEDNLFCLDVLNQCASILVIDDIFYTYKYHEDSLTRIPNYKRNYEQELLFAEKLFEREWSMISDGFPIRLIMILNNIINNLQKMDISYKEKWNLLNEFLELMERNHFTFKFEHIDQYKLTNNKRRLAKLMTVKPEFFRNLLLRILLMMKKD